MCKRQGQGGSTMGGGAEPDRPRLQHDYNHPCVIKLQMRCEKSMTGVQAAAGLLWVVGLG